MNGKSMIFVGGLVLLIGFLWLFNNLGLTDVNLGRLIATYWPVILLLWGFGALGEGLFGSKDEQGKRTANSGGIISGLILLAIGVIFLGRNLNLFHFNLSLFWKIFWPLVVILIGWSLIRGTRKMTSTKGTHWAVMSGLEFKNKGWKLDDSNVFAFMGGADLDLTTAEIPEREVVLNLVTVMGGIDIRVPRELTVVSEGTAVLGGVDFLQESAGGIISGRKAEYNGDPSSRKKLVIRALAVLGGIEVKH